LPAGRGEKNLQTPSTSGDAEEAKRAFTPSLQGGGRGVGQGRTATITEAVTALLKANAERIAITRTRTPFDRCGYQLHGVLSATGVDLAKLLVGSEGTLAVITEATLRTIPLAGGTCVTILGFPTLDAAVRAGLALRQFAPAGCDLLDRRLLSVMRRPANGEGNGQIPSSVGAALVVTVEGNTEREAT